MEDLTVLQVLQKLVEGGLIEGDEFIYYTGNETCNPHSVVLRVGYKGEYVTESWIDQYGRIIKNNWTIYKNNVKSNNVFQKKKRSSWR